MSNGWIFDINKCKQYIVFLQNFLRRYESYKWHGTMDICQKFYYKHSWLKHALIDVKPKPYYKFGDSVIPSGIEVLIINADQGYHIGHISSGSFYATTKELYMDKKYIVIKWSNPPPEGGFEVFYGLDKVTYGPQRCSGPNYSYLNLDTSVLFDPVKYPNSSSNRFYFSRSIYQRFYYDDNYANMGWCRYAGVYQEEAGTLWGKWFYDKTINKYVLTYSNGNIYFLSSFTDCYLRLYVGGGSIWMLFNQGIARERLVFLTDICLYNKYF